MKRIFHVTTRDEAAAARRSGEYVAAGFDAESFVHCSYAEQLTRVADARFRGQQDLVILEIDPAALPCRVVDENLEGGATLFPHIYGHIPMAAVAQVHDFPCREDGTFELPAALS